MSCAAGYTFGKPAGQDWLRQVFASKTAASGGIVRRAVRDVEREVGSAALELEVRKRGFHLLRCGEHYIIICNSDPVQMIC